MNRRTFIESSLATVAISSIPFRGFAAAHQLDHIGLELYTVRTLMKTDVPGTLGKVAAVGYKEVEFAGYFDHSPKDLRAMLDKDGLSAPACHVGYDVVENKWPETLEAGHTMGHNYIICPWIDEEQRKSADGYKRAAELFDKAGETARKAGIQFGYHNHYWEFMPDKSLGGKLPYDYLLENTNPENVKMELDLCWISVAGKDPIAYFKKYPGRFVLVHVKDLSKLPTIDPSKESHAMIGDVAKNFTPVGGGVIDWKKLLPAAQDAGVKHFFVENDEPKDPIANITASYEYLSKLRF
jgi:sugar phosphate isomerase/epimerase